MHVQSKSESPDNYELRIMDYELFPFLPKISSYLWIILSVQEISNWIIVATN